MADLTDDEILKVADRVWEEGHINAISPTTAIIYARAILALNKSKLAIVGNKNKLTEDEHALMLTCINCAINNACSHAETQELFELFSVVNEFVTEGIAADVDGGGKV